MKKTIKKYMISAVLMTMLAPAGTWTMDNMDNDEEQKEISEESDYGSFSVDEDGDVDGGEDGDEDNLLFQEGKKNLSREDLTPDQRRALLSPVLQEHLDQHLFNWQACCFFSVDDLWKLGADVNVKNKRGERLLEKTLKNRDLTMVEFLVERGALVDDAIRGDIEQLRLTRDLFKAIKENRKDKVLACLVAGAQVNGKYNCSENSYEDNFDVNEVDKITPLELACRHGFSEIVELLLDRGAVINRLSGYYSTIPVALVEAEQSQNIDVVKILIMAGARIETKCNWEEKCLLVKKSEIKIKGKLQKSYIRYVITDPFAQAIIYALAMRDMLEAQDWSSTDVQKNEDLMDGLSVPGLPGLVSDYADFYDKELDFYSSNDSSVCDSVMALVGGYTDEEIGSDYMSLNRIMKREIERRRRRRKAGKPSLPERVLVERTSADTSAVMPVGEEEIKEAAAEPAAQLGSGVAMSPRFEAAVLPARARVNSLSAAAAVAITIGERFGTQEEVACFRCTAFNSSRERNCTVCGTLLPDSDGFFDEEQ